MAKSEIITLAQLKKEVDTAIKILGGDKKILIADDDEGNGYHPMFFAVTDPSQWKVEDLMYANLYGVSPMDAINNYVILG